MKPIPRDHLIVDLPLAALGASLTNNVLQQRINAQKRSLYSDIPSLKNLRASSLVSRYKILETGMWLGFYLEETAQMALQLPADKSAGSMSTDLFDQDVALVEHEQKQIRPRIVRALSPAVDPAEDGTVLSIRKRLKRTHRSDGFLIPSGPVPEPFLCEYLPTVMPRCIQLTVRARFNWLSPSKTEVTIREGINPLGDDFISLLPLGKMNLLRTGTHRRPASGHRLQEAMDTKRDLLLVVTVALSWVSGEPLYLELVSFANDEMDVSREIDPTKLQSARSQHPLNPSSPTE